MNHKIGKLFCTLIIVLQAPIAISMAIEARGGTGMFFDIQEPESEFNSGALFDAALGIEFDLGGQSYLIEVEANTVSLPMPSTDLMIAPEADAPDYEEFKNDNADISTMIRVNAFNIHQLSDHWSVYYGVSVIGARVNEYHIIREFGDVTLNEDSQYNAYYFGLNSQLDYRVFSISGLSVHAYANPFNYYFNLGFSSDVGLKIKATF